MDWIMMGVGFNYYERTHRSIGRAGDFPSTRELVRLGNNGLTLRSSGAKGKMLYHMAHCLLHTHYVAYLAVCGTVARAGVLHDWSEWSGVWERSGREVGDSRSVKLH
jgi:hypothetical protein